MTWVERAITALQVLQQGAWLKNDTVNVHEIMKLAFQQADEFMGRDLSDTDEDRFKDLKTLRHG